MNAYSRKGHVRKKLYTNACDNKKKKKKENKPQMLVANEKGLP